MRGPIGVAGREALRLARAAASAGQVRERTSPAQPLALLPLAPSIQRQAGAGEVVSAPANSTAAREPASAQGAASQQMPAPEAVAERVYWLLVEELRRDRERRAVRG